MDVLLSDVLALPASSKLQLADELAVAAGGMESFVLGLGVGRIVNFEEAVFRMLRKTGDNRICWSKLPISPRKSGFSVIF